MTELNDAMFKAAEKAFDRVWKGAAYQGMAQDAIRAALTAALALLPEAEQGWQPIETAPKDGLYWVFEPERDRVVLAEPVTAFGQPAWRKFKSSAHDFFVKPTLWIECRLPAPPPAEGAAKS